MFVYWCFRFDYYTHFSTVHNSTYSVQDGVQEEMIEWIALDNNCWEECDKNGGSCSACMEYETEAISAYCCSGVNHISGNGPVSNGDCPADAISIQKSTTHSCVISKKRGKSLFKVFISRRFIGNWAFSFPHKKNEI